MDFKKLSSLTLIFLIGIVVLSAVASALPVAIDDVKVNGDSVSPSDSNKISVERGEELEVKVILTSSEAVDNVQIRAEISGYEYDYVDSVSDITKTFDMDANATHKKYLYIDLPENVEVDSYKLRVFVTNRDDVEVVENYNLKIDAERHKVVIKDIILTPAYEIVAGRSLLAAVRVENMGNRDEDSVKVTVSIPDLGVSASDYIDELDEDDAETSEELFLRIPTCAEPDVYEVVAKVVYDDGHEDVSETALVNIVESGTCAEHDADVVEEEEEVIVEEEEEEVILNDESEVEEQKDTLRTLLEVALIGLIVILVIVGIVAGFAGIKKDEF